MTQRRTGRCLCGAVAFEVTGVPREPVACHCSQCRRTSGHYAAFAVAPLAELKLTESVGLKWYRSSESAERGFCSECGSSLFWKPSGQDTIAFAAGCLDEPSGMVLQGHIFAADKGDYYALDDGLPVYPEGDGGALAVQTSRLA